MSAGCAGASGRGETRDERGRWRTPVPMAESRSVSGHGHGSWRWGCRWWNSPLWRKAPLALVHHQTAFAAVAAAGFLVALAGSSAPLVTTATASAALKNQLVDLSPLATGLEITQIASSTRPLAVLIHEADRRQQAISKLAARLRLERPVFTVESSLPVTLATASGDVPVRLMARTGVLGHVVLLERTTGAGVWISDFTARIAHLGPGGKLRLSFAAQGGESRPLVLRVKGIYRALDSTTPSPYWVHFLREILPPGVDPPPPTRYVLLGRDTLLRSARALATSRTVSGEGRGYHFGVGPPLTSSAELAVDPQGLTLARARGLSRRFTRLRQQLRGSSLGGAVGCTGPAPSLSPGSLRPPRCTVSSSLSSAVVIANRNASEISPVVKLLSGAAVAIALAFAGAAGVFLVRRRSVEAALHYARGEQISVFGVRTGLELLLPVAVGACCGLGMALALTGVLAPSGSIVGGAVSNALESAAVAAVAALVLAAVTASVVFSQQFDSGARVHRGIRRIPWELPVLAAGGWLLHEVLSGGGLAPSTATGGDHPTLAVFVFPLLLVAAAAGLAARALRRLLRPRPGRGERLATAPFLALRRLSGARGLLTALLVVSAVSFGAYFYAQALATSLDAGVTEKGYIAYGGDAQGFVSNSTTLPPKGPYPMTKLDYGNQAALVGGPNGDYADILAVDASTLGTVIRWYPNWGPDPRPLLPGLARPADGRLPVIVTRDVPPKTTAIWVQGARVPVRVIATATAFPGMTSTPLVVADRAALLAATRRAGVLDPLSDPPTYVWAKGPPSRVAETLAARPIEATFVTSVDSFRKQSDVIVATRSFSFMQLVAAVSGVLVFLGLVLYLQARQRSQAVASALARRMGLSRRTEVGSLALELGAIMLVAALVGGSVAIAAAGPIVAHIDPLPGDPPAPALALPLAAIAASAIGLVVVAVAASVFTSWASRRTDIGEALRVA